MAGLILVPANPALPYDTSELPYLNIGVRLSTIPHLIANDTDSLSIKFRFYAHGLAFEEIPITKHLFPSCCAVRWYEYYYCKVCKSMRFSENLFVYNILLLTFQWGGYCLQYSYQATIAEYCKQSIHIKKGGIISLPRLAFDSLPSTSPPSSCALPSSVSLSHA